VVLDLLTVSEAIAVEPVPPSIDVIAPVVLILLPAPVAVTLIENVHPALCASAAPDRLMTMVFGVAVIVPPPQLPLKPFGVAIARPDGNVSLKPMPVNAVDVLGLLIVKVSVLLAPTTTLVGLKPALIVGGPTTVSIAVLLVVPVPPLIELTTPVALL
jgi:hypothetical protein